MNERRFNLLAAAAVIVTMIVASCSSSSGTDTAGETTRPSNTPVSAEPSPSTAVADSDSTAPLGSDPSNAIEDQLDATLVAWAERAEIPGVIARIDGPEGFQWSGAAGTTAIDDIEPLTTEHPFRIASITKTITATTVLRLAEDGAIDLDGTIDNYLPAALVDTVHVTDGISRGDQITIRQLLGHTSGIYDYVTDPSFVPDVLADPKRAWTPQGLIDYAVTHGAPHFEPDAGYHYSDTGYVLLGLIIEQATDRPLHRVYREMLFDQLGMDHTYLEGFEPAAGLPLSHPYLDQVDGLAIHHSVDWAGGGLVSTAEDLSTLITALSNGDVFSDPATFQQMTQLRTTDIGPNYELLYGLGWLGFRSGAFEMVGHDGFWGSFMYTLPDTGITITGTINQADVSQLDLILELLQTLPPQTD